MSYSVVSVLTSKIGGFVSGMGVLCGGAKTSDFGTLVYSVNSHAE
jgi:hypothetical protein